ncbi:UNVERIFIED_CONTAM: hypothetical protein Scaly_0845000 [Sesamum calycinum]|uniref:Retrotransposon gag domain-containing protein n=1 Tax=Sesamum calycinum TaxID=2727403 RepID=A0AAW2QVF1_9LAMI
MAANPNNNSGTSFLPEIGPDGLARESPVIAYTEKINCHLLRLEDYLRFYCPFLFVIPRLKDVEFTYRKLLQIRDVERELANLTMEMKLTSGPKKAGMSVLLNSCERIEMSTERIHVAKLKEEQAKKAWEAASKAVKDEEAIKEKLCEDLNNLVKESSNAQLSRLEELKRRLEALNPSRSSICVPSSERRKKWSKMPKLEKLTALEKLLGMPTPKPAEIGLLKEGELEFDPEIEKTARRLRKETKQLKGEASTSSTSKADFELDVPTSSESEEEVMAQNPERTINEMTSPDLNQQPLCIEYPTLDVDFELKSGLIHLLPTFRGLAGDKAKDWLYSLPSGTIVSWNELKKQFLENYFPASRTTNIRKDISGIRQFSGESFYEYWGRFKQLVESCPHHQIPDHLLIQYFYEGLFEANRSLVDAASGGALYDKTPTEARKLITTMAANNQQFGNRSDNPPRKVHEVSTSVDERLDKLTFLVEKILVGGTQQVKACGICTSSGHFTDACPTLQEEPTIHANAVGGFSGPSQRGHDFPIHTTPDGETTQT